MHCSSSPNSEYSASDFLGETSLKATTCCSYQPSPSVVCCRSLINRVLLSTLFDPAGNALSLQCPLPHARGGHIRCFVIRECITNSITGKTYKYTLYQGNDYNNRASAKFLLAAVQEKGKRKFAIYMTFNCTGRPVAQLSGNVMGTSYALVSNVSTSSSSSSRNKDALQVAYKLRVRGMMLPRR